MIARVLPPGEYGRLERTGVQTLAPYVRAEDLATVVVEDGEKVVACMTVLRATHFESVWVDPEARNAGVVRALLKEASRVARQWTDDFVFGGAENDVMRETLGRLGAIWLPYDPCLLPLRGEACQPLLSSQQ